MLHAKSKVWMLMTSVALVFLLSTTFASGVEEEKSDQMIQPKVVDPGCSIILCYSDCQSSSAPNQKHTCKTYAKAEHYDENGNPLSVEVTAYADCAADMAGECSTERINSGYGEVYVETECSFWTLYAWECVTVNSSCSCSD